MLAEAQRREREAAEEAERKRRREADARALAETMAKEAEQRRIQQQQNDLLDARQMLEAWVTRFGHLPGFATIASLIEDFLTEDQKKAA